MESFHLLGGFSNNVFACSKGKETCILKFYPSATYKKESIVSELEWIYFLYTSGINVTRPLYSVNEKFLETVEVNNEKCYVLCFEKARGTLINTSDPKMWNRAFFYTWGQLLGNIHSLSKAFTPSKKQHWNTGLLFTKPPSTVDDVIMSKWKEFLNELHQLPKEAHNYGMIHNDLHQKNFFVSDREIILFDFGDCEYNWFMYDIAIVIYHAVQSVDESEKTTFSTLFIQSFLQGYLTKNDLDSYWLTKLPFFLNYRQLFFYLYFVSFLTEEQKNNKKVKTILLNMKNKIKNNISYLQIDCKDIV
jgi:amicoumacin kinase